MPVSDGFRVFMYSCAVVAVFMMCIMALFIGAAVLNGQFTPK